MDIPENDVARFFVENTLSEVQQKLFYDNYLPLNNFDFNKEIFWLKCTIFLKLIKIKLSQFFDRQKPNVRQKYTPKFNSNAS